MQVELRLTATWWSPHRTPEAPDADYLTKETFTAVPGIPYTALSVFAPDTVLANHSL